MTAGLLNGVKPNNAKWVKVPARIRYAQIPKNLPIMISIQEEIKVKYINGEGTHTFLEVFCNGVPTNYIFLLRNLIKCLEKIDSV